VYVPAQPLLSVIAILTGKFCDPVPYAGNRHVGFCIVELGGTLVVPNVQLYNQDVAGIGDGGGGYETVGVNVTDPH